MELWELVVTALGLAMDAFAVAICKGVATETVKLKHMVVVGLWFGGFQALMPLIGYFVGSTFESYITAIDHWIAFILLGFIGANMVREALCGKDESADASLAVGAMLTMALATSIDALAVGISYALLPDVDIIFAVAAIGIITFVTSMAGVKIGNVFGTKFKSRAELVGGIVLILMGTKILVEHTGVLDLIFS